MFRTVDVFVGIGQSAVTVVAHMNCLLIVKIDFERIRLAPSGQADQRQRHLVA